MPLNLDRDLYVVVSELPNCGPIILEVELSRMEPAEVLTDIKHGQYGVVLSLIQINVGEKTCRDITHDHQALINEVNALIDRNREGRPDLE